ncbi:hypothetical protein QD336_00020 [Rhizobium sp. BR 250]
MMQAQENVSQVTRKKNPKEANWAVFINARRPRLFKVMQSVRGNIIVKATFDDGTPVHGGSQYELKKSSINSDEWQLCHTFEEAESVLDERL